MNARINETSSSLKQVAEEATGRFGELSAEQLNWKPSEKEWSVAQCFDHLIRTHSLYFPLLERMAADGVKPTFWERTSPLSGFFGRFLARSLDPANQKKMKTTSKAVPSSSDITGDIIQQFAHHQDEMVDHFGKLPDGLDPERVIITSPLMGFVTYSLADMLVIIDFHCRRHFGQAVRVTETAGFPK